jgi:alpha-beta hydrolase superfamily lysophospholipase
MLVFLIILFSVIGLLLIYFLIPFIFAVVFNNKVYHHHCDDPKHPCYVHFEDYPTLDRKPYSCEIPGAIIRGYLYQEKNKRKFKGFIILSHGMFGTHIQYLVDVSYLTKEGYQVLCYDQYGCGQSDGDDQISLAHGISVLDYVIKDVEAKNLNKNLDLILYGHSWGAYCSLGVLKDHPEIEKAVCRSGPIGPMRAGLNLVSVNMPVFYRIFKPALHMSLIMVMGKKNIVSSTREFKNNTHTKVFITYAQDDPMIFYRNSQYFYFVKHPNEQVKLQLTNKGLHNSIITEESFASFVNKTKEFHAIEAMEDPIKKAQEEKRFYSNLDRASMVVYNDEVKDAIIAFLKD